MVLFVVRLDLLQVLVEDLLALWILIIRVGLRVLRNVPLEVVVRVQQGAISSGEGHILLCWGRLDVHAEHFVTAAGLSRELDVDPRQLRRDLPRNRRVQEERDIPRLDWATEAVDDNLPSTAWELDGAGVACIISVLQDRQGPDLCHDRVGCGRDDLIHVPHAGERGSAPERQQRWLESRDVPMC